MKKSKFITYIERDDISYWYNSLQNSYFKLPISLGSKLYALIHTSENIDLKYIPEELLNKLKAGGFIINDDFDELNEVRRRFNSEVNSKHAFLVILPTLNCNYSCWYCIQDHVVSQMSKQTMDKIKKYINNLIENDKIDHLHIDWFGGEPFMYYEKVIKPLSQYISQKCAEFNIEFVNSATTNAYFLTDNVVGELEQLKFSFFQITLDGKRESHDKVKFKPGLNSAFDRTLNNINNILQRNPDIQIQLRINYTHENIDNEIVNQVSERIESIHRNRVRIFARKVWQESVRKGFGNKIFEILENFESAGFPVEYWNPILDSVPCYASRKSYVAINYNGDVLKCTACDDLYAKESLAYINNSGRIVWKSNLQSEFCQPTFENDECLNCSILPVCMGQCPQHFRKVKLNAN